MGDFIVTHSRRPVQRRVMIGTAEAIGVEQRNHRFLSGGRQQRPFLEGENRRTSGTDIQVLLLEIFPVRGSECVEQPKVLETHRHHSMSELARSRIVSPIGCLRVNAFRSGNKAAAPPRAASSAVTRVKLHHSPRRILQIDSGKVSHRPAAPPRR